MTDTLYIRDSASLARLVDRIAEADELAIDTEFLRERTYYARLCLLQLATLDVMALVDPLAVEDLDPLWDVICEGPEIVLHAGGQDLEIIQRLAGRIPRRLFDTQIAAAFIGLGDSVGYAKLVESVLGQGPGRSEAYTDWSRRPLSEEQQQYALDDVRYLLEVASVMRGRLRSLEREPWVEEETEKRLDAVCHSPDPFEQWRRVKGSRGLSGRNLAVLQEVAAWREEEAVRRDIPRQRVVPDRVLTEIARRTPRSADRVGKLRGFHPREASRSAETVAARVRRAVESPKSDWPAWPDRPRLPDDPSVDAAASLLDAVVRARALEMELASRLLATKSDLTLLVRLSLNGTAEERTDLPLMSGWRRRVVGDELLRLLEGKSSVRVKPANRSLSLEVY